MLSTDTNKKPGTFTEELYIAYRLGIELDVACKEINALKEEVSALTEENQRLKEQLGLAQAAQFGKKSEASKESLAEADQCPEGSTGVIHVKGYNRKKKSCGRLLDTSQLPRHKMYHDLAKTDKVCASCKNALKRIGEDVSEQVEVVPQQLYVVEHIRYKYACTECETVKMAEKPMSPIPKAMAGASLLTEIVINKYQYHLPLYRQSKIYASYNMLIPDNTLGNWVMRLGGGLECLSEGLWTEILASRYLQVDETPIKILKPEKKGYMWTYYAPHIGGGLVVFDLRLSRSGDIAMERLKDYKGLLQTDGYRGYDDLRKREDIIGLGCLSHGRRKFSEALKISSDHEGIAAKLIEMLKPVYALEARMRAAGYSFHTKKRLRQKSAWPILKSVKHFLKVNQHRVPPKSKLGNAMSYMLKQWHYIIKYLRHGQAEIDTNWVEDEIRAIALGRKNWLFMGNEDSGAVHALFYSLILSCVLNKLNPRLYIHYIITKIHDLRQGKVEAKTLLPHTIDRDALQTFAKTEIEKAKKIFNSS
jgi:transposase